MKAPDSTESGACLRWGDTGSLPSWGSRARETFLTAWGLVPLVSILNYLPVINSRSGVGLMISILVAIVWTVSELMWAVPSTGAGTDG